jgi:hypothetical protein
MDVLHRKSRPGERLAKCRIVALDFALQRGWEKMTVKVKIGGVVRVLTDKEPRFVEWVEYDGRAWLAGPWLTAHDGKSQRPLRIIALRFAPGYEPIPGPEVLQFFERIQVPTSLLDQGYLPDQFDRLRPQIEVRENPDIYTDVPASPHLQ